MIGDIATQTYDGSALNPTITVADGAQSIITIGDYAVSYSSNTNAGTAMATIAATQSGNYSGSASRSFTINKATPTVTVMAVKKSEKNLLNRLLANFFADYKNTIILTATVGLPNNAVAPAPTGTVIFTDKENSVATIPLKSGKATYAYMPSANAHTITAAYTPAGTEINYNGAGSTGVTFDIDKTGMGTISIEGDPIFGETLTANFTPPDGGAITYQWFRNGATTAIETATGTTYQLQEDDMNCIMSVMVSAEKNYNPSTSLPTGAVQKATPMTRFPTAAGIHYGRRWQTQLCPADRAYRRAARSPLHLQTQIPIRMSKRMWQCLRTRQRQLLVLLRVQCATGKNCPTASLQAALQPIPMTVQQWTAHGLGRTKPHSLPSQATNR